MPTKEDIAVLIAENNKIWMEIKKHREETNRRFEEAAKEREKRFEETNRRFEEAAKEREKIWEEIHKHREETKRYQEETKKQFEQVDNRFEEMQEQIDRRFDKVFARFDELSIALGHDFEEFNSLWLQDFLRAQGYPKLKIKKKTFVDEEFEVFPDSTDVEIDVYNENPLVIGEITAITRTLSKVTLFLRKVKFLEKKKKAKAQTFFITYGFDPKIRDKAVELLEEAGVKVYTLRQRDLE